ncbi:hypothetical protein ACQPZX_21960 [Actinoplanes sp. CA-142083]|uniref:hypothetical protein n=1 Tax=Actinoplanes sp. CA-142083 TaxID=3239903 RepID=UPI003D912C88
MVEMIEVGDFSRSRRVDTVTAASIVLTINAALFLLIAVVGAPFLAYIFADDDTGTWDRMWPLVTWWVVAAGLGAASARVAVQAIGRGNHDFRRSGIAAALATAAAISVLVVTSFGRSPFIAAVGGLFALANLFAAFALRNSDDPVAEEEFELEEDEEEDAIEEDAYEEEPEPEEEAPARETIELSPRANRGPGRAAPAAARRRMRRQAALVTLTGVRMTRRPRR